MRCGRPQHGARPLFYLDICLELRHWLTRYLSFRPYALIISDDYDRA